MFVPRLRKYGHVPTVASRKSVNGFIEHGLRVIAAKPAFHFHQTLTFPTAITEPKAAKTAFLRFIKPVMKHYGRFDMACAYYQETRERKLAIHFHVCFFFFREDNLPFCQSRLRRDFRTDLFKRWNAIVGGLAVHKANALTEHPVFNQDSMCYFTKALFVSDGPTERAETNWWGGFNNHLIEARSAVPTRLEKKAAFDAFFRRGERIVSKLTESHCQAEHYQGDDLQTEKE